MLTFTYPYSFAEGAIVVPFNPSQAVRVYVLGCNGSRNETLYETGRKLYQHCRVVAFTDFPVPRTFVREFFIEHENQYLGTFCSWGWETRARTHILRTKQAIFTEENSESLAAIIPYQNPQGDVVGDITLIGKEATIAGSKYFESRTEFTLEFDIEGESYLSHFATKVPLVPWGFLDAAMGLLVEPLVETAFGRILVMYPFVSE